MSDSQAGMRRIFSLQAMFRKQQEVRVRRGTSSKVCCYYPSHDLPLTIPRNDRDLKNIVRTTTETLREVCALVPQQKEPSRSLGRLLITGSLHLKSLEVDQETHKTLFSSPKLRELSEAYIGNVHILNPMFNAPRKMCDDFIEEYSDTAAERRDSITPCLHNANVLLFLALGICVTIRDGSRPPGMEYYSYAQGILAHEQEANSVALAQTMTLAALYTNQVGRLCESWKNIDCAYRIYMDLGY
jgi:hypothetical protein